jgi:hypothetical protein
MARAALRHLILTLSGNQFIVGDILFPRSDFEQQGRRGLVFQNPFPHKMNWIRADNFGLLGPP